MIYLFTAPMTYHFIAVECLILEILDHIAGESREKGKRMPTIVGNKNRTDIMENITEFSSHPDTNRSAIWPSNPSSGYISKEMISITHRIIDILISHLQHTM